MKKTSLIFLSLIIVAIGAMVYFLYPKPQPSQMNSPSVNTTSTKPALMAGWKECNYPFFSFYLQYPSNWIITTISNSQGGGNEPPVVIECGNSVPGLTAGDLTFTAAGGNTSTKNSGMSMTIGDDANGKSISEELAQNPAYYTIAFGINTDAITSTSTLDGAESLILHDGTVIALYNGRNYEISFFQGTDTSTRASILQTFRFLTQ